MKASINGVPHLSIGDGWWAEGYTGQNGWLIDGRPQNADPDAVDAADAEALYQLLEREVRPPPGSETGEFIQHLVDGAKRMWSLISDLRTFTAIRAAFQRTPHGEAIRRGDVRAGAPAA